MTQPEQKRPQNCGTSYCSCIECVMEPDYKALWEQMCERCDELDKKLAQPEQERVAWLVYAKGSRRYFTLTFDVEKVPEIYKGGEAVPLYTTPPQRKPLTHEQRFDLLTKFEPHKNKWEAPAILIDMVEAVHGIKE